MESVEVAEKLLSVSANVSGFAALSEGAATCPDSLEAAVEVAAPALNRPVQSFGVVQAFGTGAASFASSAAGCSVAGSVVAVEACSATGPALGASLAAFSGVALGVGRARDFGKAGIIGKAGGGDLWTGLGGTGVLSPAVTGTCEDEGVVGLVELASSDAGWLVEGVSGRGVCASAASLTSSST